MIAAVLLAAGRGTRFGGDKLLAPLHGKAVLRWSAEAMAGSVDGVWVVVPPGAGALRDVLRGLAVHLVEHGARDDGMGSSLAAGVRALPDAAEAVVVALADQPLVSGGVVAELLARWQASGAPAVVPRYRDGRGHPVLFSRSCLPELAALSGDQGARGVLEALGASVEVVPVDADMPRDVDTRAALAALAALARAEPR